MNKTDELIKIKNMI